MKPREYEAGSSNNVGLHHIASLFYPAAVDYPKFHGIGSGDVCVVVVPHPGGESTYGALSAAKHLHVFHTAGGRNCTLAGNTMVSSQEALRILGGVKQPMVKHLFSVAHT